MKYSLKLISHACVLIKLDDVIILTDPWLFGDVFNNGWSLKFRKSFNSSNEILTQSEIDSITHIWISHEHPDHFHVPSLRFISSRVSDFRKITILLKKDLRTEKDIFPVFKKIGFLNFKILNHNEIEKLSEKISIAIYHHKHTDSSLVILKNNKPFILNINDSELNENDCKLIKKKFGSFPLLLNQFSFGGFDGILDDEKLERKSKSKLDLMINMHINLEAQTTIPFASFCWFSKEDNKFLNKWHNSLEDVSRQFEEKKIKCYCAEPPSEYLDIYKIIGCNKRSNEGLINVIPKKESKIDLNIEELKKLILVRFKELKSKSNNFLFYFVEKEIYFEVKDAGLLIILNLRRSSIKHENIGEINNLNQPRMIINLNPLYNAFKFTWGIQALGISGRYYFANSTKVPRNWKLLRILSAFDNNQTPLRFSSLLKPSLHSTILKRFSSLPMQFKQQFQRYIDN